MVLRQEMSSSEIKKWSAVATPLDDFGHFDVLLVQNFFSI